MSQNINQLAESFCQFVQTTFKTTDFIPLHIPTLNGNEEAYVVDAIRSTFVSTVGQRVVDFEQQMATYLGVKHAVAMVNGTAALHIALLAVGVKPDSEVLTQPLSFVATTNAIHYCNAEPVFIDVDAASMSLCPKALASWLEQNAEIVDGKAINKHTQKPISACVPMHSFGFIGDIEGVIEVCQQYGIPVVEDAAESLGSTKNDQHAGTFASCGAISFNGNKIMTTGGGGMLVTNDDEIAQVARHLSTTAKVPHKWEYVHDVVGFNFRMPNLNAALGVAQLEQVPSFMRAKRELAKSYQAFFADTEITFITELPNTQVNYWLCTVKLADKTQRDAFLTVTNDSGIMTRPAWQLLNTLPAFKHCQAGPLPNATHLADCIVNIPSSVIV
ncbi:LegC family aminotransferase [Alteromonas sp. a30]|uniref:LegC family aminotransferase n=1 Tax=Alteromonas sp. a30 TaxID=2730917 RepID=UPI0022820BE5|nr:LegC family aminotransferase [Alteromonas sp. a30]MCY7294361.1 LegC family aminotransferase [Alteromonas sp. a30]